MLKLASQTVAGFREEMHNTDIWVPASKLKTLYYKSTFPHTRIPLV